MFIELKLKRQNLKVNISVAKLEQQHLRVIQPQGIILKEGGQRKKMFGKTNSQLNFVRKLLWWGLLGKRKGRGMVIISFHHL